MTFFVYSRWVREDGKSPNEPESDDLLGGFGLLGRELESERDSYRRAGYGQPTKAEAGQWCLKPWSLGLVAEGTGGGWVFLGES